MADIDQSKNSDWFSAKWGSAKYVFVISAFRYLSISTFCRFGGMRLRFITNSVQYLHWEKYAVETTWNQRCFYVGRAGCAFNSDSVLPQRKISVESSRSQIALNQLGDQRRNYVGRKLNSHDNNNITILCACASLAKISSGLSRSFYVRPRLIQLERSYMNTPRWFTV